MIDNTQNVQRAIQVLVDRHQNGHIEPCGDCGFDVKRINRRKYY